MTRLLGSGDRPFDVAGEVDHLRYLLERASALGRALEGTIQREPWGDDADEDRRRLVDLSHLVGAAVEALLVATDVGDLLAAQLAKQTNDHIATELTKLTKRRTGV